MDCPSPDDRRRFAAMDAQNQVNQEMAEQARVDSEKGGGFGCLMSMLTVIFFKPFAEYCIDLYDTLAGYAHSLAALLGF